MYNIIITKAYLQYGFLLTLSHYLSLSFITLGRCFLNYLTWLISRGFILCAQGTVPHLQVCAEFEFLVKFQVFLFVVLHHSMWKAQCAEGCRIHRLHVCRGVNLTPPHTTSVRDMILIYLMVRPGPLRNVDYTFIAITSRFTLTGSGSTC